MPRSYFLPPATIDERFDSFTIFWVDFGKSDSHPPFGLTVDDDAIGFDRVPFAITQRDLQVFSLNGSAVLTKSPPELSVVDNSFSSVDPAWQSTAKRWRILLFFLRDPLLGVQGGKSLSLIETIESL